MKVKLHIRGPYETRSVEVTGELSIGRSDQADIAWSDDGLSRVNTTFFIDNDELLVADENSTNGTFLNGEMIKGRPRTLRNGDRITIGSTTEIEVSIADSRSSDGFQNTFQPAATPNRSEAPTSPPPPARSSTPTPKNEDGPPLVVIASVIMTLAILLLGGLAYFIVSMTSDPSTGSGSQGKNQTTASAVIPARVIDPLGYEDEYDVEDLIASWEVAENEIVASDVSDVTVGSGMNEEFDLNVSSAFLEDRQRKAMEKRNGPTGVKHPDLNPPKELFGDGVIKQKWKLGQMNRSGYRQPMDFADLAEKRMSGELMEMPMATESFYLDVGGSAQDIAFESFSFKDNKQKIVPGHPKYDTLKRLADNFAGQKFDLENAADRKQMRRRLLRMFQPRARHILKELADHYFQRFGRPLRVTSLTRSMDYQMLLNQGNANSFKVRGEGSLPPHTSGCAFDLARKHMTIEEQNYLMQKLAEMERADKLDALIEYGVNACFHVFIYHDGVAPTRASLTSISVDSFPFLAELSLK
ncbi:MAG: FHA domain-containing protein [Acidobacteria bacterium]|nr:FHA domain-containing protein [Acidobacteriota bacterium]